MKNYDDTNDFKNNYVDECANCVYGVTLMMMIMMMCYRSVVLFIPFGVIAFFPCSSKAFSSITYSFE